MLPSSCRMFLCKLIDMDDIPLLNDVFRNYVPAIFSGGYLMNQRTIYRYDHFEEYRQGA